MKRVLSCVALILVSSLAGGCASSPANPPEPSSKHKAALTLHEALLGYAGRGCELTGGPRGERNNAYSLTIDYPGVNRWKIDMVGKDFLRVIMVKGKGQRPTYIPFSSIRNIDGPE